MAACDEKGEFVLSEGLDDYGSALSVLYHFRLDDYILHTPTLGDLRKIDLQKIAEEPSAAYEQVMLDMRERMFGWE